MDVRQVVVNTVQKGPLLSETSVLFVNSPCPRSQKLGVRLEEHIGWSRRPMLFSCILNCSLVLLLPRRQDSWLTEALYHLSRVRGRLMLPQHMKLRCSTDGKKGPQIMMSLLLWGPWIKPITSMIETIRSLNIILFSFFSSKKNTHSSSLHRPILGVLYCSPKGVSFEDIVFGALQSHMSPDGLKYR